MKCATIIAEKEKVQEQSFQTDDRGVRSIDARVARELERNLQQQAKRDWTDLRRKRSVAEGNMSG